ncbi:MAG: pyridoxal phosphate-dependent aminotransferase [Acidobacteria bacterium]|nr:pyridoxal phosphate-dependent aminotransferase [Acidobacteriota bacterium]
MRRNIVHIGAGELTYTIREIVEHAGRLEALGVEMAWENIGDPVQKGERIPDWIKGIVADLVQDDSTYGYCPTRGELPTREFLAARVTARGGARITPDNILFFNGLGDAVSKAFGFLRREARVIGPSPAYSTHSSAEGAHAGDHPITYTLDPDQGWRPDLDEMRQKVRYNPAIAGILLINPDNPTGVVYSRDTLEEVVAIAREFDLFVMCDEVYINITYGDAPAVHLSDVIGDVCGLSLKGISKEIPWPGSRCGWVEFYNQDTDPIFARFARSLLDAKMLEVCSTTLPQRAIPKILGDTRYPAHLTARAAEFKRRAGEACAVLSRVPGITVHEPQGAFYLTVLFDRDILKTAMSLPLPDPRIQQLIDELVAQHPEPDFRFVYYLMGATGIVVVPLSSFCCVRHGFRITLLECDDRRRVAMFDTLAGVIAAYLASDVS